MTSETERERATRQEGRTLPGQGGVVRERTSEDPRSVTGAAENTPVLPENLNRRGLSVTNDSTATVYLGLGKAAVLHDDIVLAPSGSWDGRVGELLWLGEVNAIGTAAWRLLIVEV